MTLSISDGNRTYTTLEELIDAHEYVFTGEELSSLAKQWLIFAKIEP